MAYSRPVKTRFPSPPYAPSTGFPPEITGFETLISLNGFWLHCECPRCRIVDTPLQLLCARYGWDVRIADVIGRLKCGKCGRRPETVELIDDPTHGAAGIPNGRPRKSIVLTTQKDSA